MSHLYKGLISQNKVSRTILLSVYLSIYSSISILDIISLCQLFYSCLAYEWFAQSLYIVGQIERKPNRRRVFIIFSDNNKIVFDSNNDIPSDLEMSVING